MIRNVAAVMLYMLIFLVPLQTPQTCEPQPDYWFSEVYSINSMLLPEQITLELSPRDSDTGFLLIQNNSEIPLYILPQNALSSILVTAEPEIAEEGLVEETIPEELLLVELVPELSPFVVTIAAPLRLDVENLSNLVPYIEARNVTDYYRPSLVYLPVTQRGEFHLVYNDQLFTVQFSISYAFNEQFNPEDCGQDLGAITDQLIDLEDNQDHVIFTSLALVLMILLTIGALLRKLHR